MHYVIDASYARGHTLKIRFEDESVKLVDFAPHLDGPVLEPLRDVTYFRSFRVNHDIDTVTWPNNADFSPDFLYEIGRVVDAPSSAASP